VAQPRGRRRVVSLSIFMLAALTLLAVGGPLRNPASSLARAIVSPFVSVVRGVTKPIGEAFAGTFNYGAVVAQNHALSSELGHLRLLQAESAFQTRQLRDLLSLNKLPFVSSLPTVTAQTTAQNLSNFAATIEIDKGSSDGVLVGMPVVAGGGLVGIVTIASSGGSTVTLITDASRTIGVTFGTAGYSAVVHGQGPSKNLAAEFVAPGTPVHAGEPFYTSGLQGGLYPAGIPVGSVVASASRQGATQLSVSIQPLANLHQLSYVDVVLWEPGS
jgi:rod shape-determining protein MreC